MAGRVTHLCTAQSLYIQCRALHTHAVTLHHDNAATQRIIDMLTTSNDSRALLPSSQRTVKARPLPPQSASAVGARRRARRLAAPRGQARGVSVYDGAGGMGWDADGLADTMEFRRHHACQPRTALQLGRTGAGAAHLTPVKRTPGAMKHVNHGSRPPLDSWASILGRTRQNRQKRASSAVGRKRASRGHGDRQQGGCAAVGRRQR